MNIIARYTYLIWFFIGTMMFFSCSEDDQEQDVYADEPIEIAVNTSWECGRGIGTSRAFIDPVGVGDDAELYPHGLYPLRFLIHITDGTSFNRPTDLPEFYIVNQSVAEDDNYKPYVEYHDVYSHHGELQPKPYYSKSQMQKLNIEAGTMMAPYDYNTVVAADLASTISSNVGIGGVYPRLWQPSDIPTFGIHDFLTTGGVARDAVDPLFNGSYHINRNHLFLDLGHATALLRLHFKVDERYDKIRKIVLRSVTVKKKDDANEVVFNSEAVNTAFSTIDDAPGFLLTTKGNTASKLVAYCYMKPSHDYNGTPFTSGWTNSVGKGTPLTFLCTYDIYDKDEPLTSEHCTRKGVTATNTTTLNMVFNSSPVEIKAGHYYDLLITINPDYLYVMAEHDNKHLTIQ